MTPYIQAAMMRESGGDATLANPRSSAKGLFQFIDGTWNDLLQRRPELGLTPDGRSDPEQQKRAMQAFTQENASFLSNRGFEPNDRNLYAAHRFGPQGAADLLSRSPDEGIASAVSPAVLRANPDLNGKTIAQALAFNSAPVRSQGGVPTPSKREEVSIPAVKEASSESFLPRGLGALFGLPQGRSSGEYDVGNALSGAGASLMAISNPEGAKVLAAQNSQTERGKNFTLHADSKGNVFRMDNRTGAIVGQRTPDAPETSEQTKAWQRNMGEQFAKMNNGILTGAEKARVAMGKLDEIQSALSNPDVYQGFGGEQFLSMKKAAVAMGFSVDGVADSEVANKISKQMALELRDPAGGAGMPGALSDGDRKFLAQMVAGLDNSPAGNAAIVAMYRKVNQRALEVEKLRQEYVQQNGMLDEGFTRALSAYAEQNPIAPRNAAQPPAQQQQQSGPQPAQKPAQRKPLSSFYR